MLYQNVNRFHIVLTAQVFNNKVLGKFLKLAVGLAIN